MIFRFNPGAEASMPWGHRVASNYDQYIVNRLSFEFVSAVSTDTAGTVHCAVDYDVTDYPAFTVREMSQLATYRSASIWSGMSLSVRPTSISPRKKYVGGIAHTSKTVSDPKFSDACSVAFLFQAPEGLHGIIGHVYVSYDITLVSPTRTTIPPEANFNSMPEVVKGSYKAGDALEINPANAFGQSTVGGAVVEFAGELAEFKSPGARKLGASGANLLLVTGAAAYDKASSFFKKDDDPDPSDEIVIEVKGVHGEAPGDTSVHGLLARQKDVALCDPIRVREGSQTVELDIPYNIESMYYTVSKDTNIQMDIGLAVLKDPVADKLLPYAVCTVDPAVNSGLPVITNENNSGLIVSPDFEGVLIQSRYQSMDSVLHTQDQSQGIGRLKLTVPASEDAPITFRVRGGAVSAASWPYEETFSLSPGQEKYVNQACWPHLNVMCTAGSGTVYLEQDNMRDHAILRPYNTWSVGVDPFVLTSMYPNSQFQTSLLHPFGEFLSEAYATVKGQKNNLRVHNPNDFDCTIAVETYGVLNYSWHQAHRMVIPAHSHTDQLNFRWKWTLGLKVGGGFAPTRFRQINVPVNQTPAFFRVEWF